MRSNFMSCSFCSIMLDSAGQSMQVEYIQVRNVAKISADGLNSREIIIYQAEVVAENYRLMLVLKVDALII